MADYIPFAPNELVVDAPITVGQGLRFANNPAAMFEGAPGAPRLADAALNPTLGAVDAIGVLWVGRRISAAAVNAVGAYVMGYAPGAANSFGDIISGSLIRASASSGATGSPVTLPGSWMCCGVTTSPSGTEDPTTKVTVWRRVT